VVCNPQLALLRESDLCFRSVPDRHRGQQPQCQVAGMLETSGAGLCPASASDTSACRARWGSVGNPGPAKRRCSRGGRWAATPQASERKPAQASSLEGNQSPIREGVRQELGYLRCR